MIRVTSLIECLAVALKTKTYLKCLETLTCGFFWLACFRTSVGAHIHNTALKKLVLQTAHKSERERERALALSEGGRRHNSTLRRVNFKHITAKREHEVSRSPTSYSSFLSVIEGACSSFYPTVCSELLGLVTWLPWVTPTPPTACVLMNLWWIYESNSCLLNRETAKLFYTLSIMLKVMELVNCPMLDLHPWISTELNWPVIVKDCTPYLD